MTKKEQYQNIISYFLKHQPDAKTELDYNTNFQLLVAVILSAQCTDKRVNMATPTLFLNFPDAKKMATAEFDEILFFIQSISYPNNKAKYLIETAKILTEKYNGEPPADIDKLQELPGVGRKTANVVASVAYDIPCMPVDTHVQRVANRIGLVKTKTPLATEKELVKQIPEKYLNSAHHWLILHGRYVCMARTPKCSECGIKEWCGFKEKRL
jgi:endonuclease-3